VLDEAQFDAFVEDACATFYAELMGRPSLAPAQYFRLLLLGYLEGLDSERTIAWRGGRFAERPELSGAPAAGNHSGPLHDFADASAD
jgi:hypothetical protein